MIDFRSTVAAVEQRQMSYDGYNDTEKYLSFRLSTHSRLGNHLFELSSLLGISRFLNRTPVFYLDTPLSKKMLKSANETSPGLIQQILVIDDIVCPRGVHSIN
uniref:Hypoxanthine-guanine phosphoribosyltransferase n=1 Tax=Caenorhabditis tropicalis TaxID=1561998 RepID=A0A1I7UF64_9PELO